MVLRGDEQLLVAVRGAREVRPRVADEAAQHVRLEAALRMRRVGAAKAVEARVEWPLGRRAATIHAGVAPPAGVRIRLVRRELVEQLADGGDADGAHERDVE